MKKEKTMDSNQSHYKTTTNTNIGHNTNLFSKWFFKNFCEKILVVYTSQFI